MIYLGTAISFVFIMLAAFLLYRKFHAAGVLLICGLAMMTTALMLGLDIESIKEPSGLFLFDLFDLIRQSFSEKGAGVGLMIMAIGGYVAYMDKIGASEALVYLAMKPLSIFKNRPYIAASLVIPLGHFLSIPIPSATGLGLLLVASVFPILISLGVSRVAAVSVIVATTTFDMGPASANTLLAAELAGKSNMLYFIEDQFTMALPLIGIMSVIYYIVNVYFDKKKDPETEETVEPIERPTTPLIYAVLPILPLIILLIFSEFFNFFVPAIKLSTTTAMFFSLAVALLFELIYKRNGKIVLASLTTFWQAMGKVFVTIITLIIGAEIFSEGLISLGFIDFLLEMAEHVGFGALGITALLSVMLFLASMLMGSGNASFFSFGPLIPDIAKRLGVDAASMILPLQFSSSLGRAVSPIAGVIIATADIAQVTPLQIVKRNLIPLTITLLAMILLSA